MFYAHSTSADTSGRCWARNSLENKSKKQKQTKKTTTVTSKSKKGYSIASLLFDGLYTLWKHATSVWWSPRRWIAQRACELVSNWIVINFLWNEQGRLRRGALKRDHDTAARGVAAGKKLQSSARLWIANLWSSIRSERTGDDHATSQKKKHTKNPTATTNNYNNKNSTAHAGRRVERDS